MAFEALQPYLDEIEMRLAKGESLRSIARTLGLPFSTLRRYKKTMFDLREEARKVWDEERKKSHEQRKAEGKARIVDNLELLNLVKLRAEELLNIKAGDKYQTANGEARSMTLYSVAALWEKAAKMATEAIKQELGLTGEDAASRAAEVLESWLELAVYADADEERRQENT